MDTRLIEAAKDLYSNAGTAFFKVTLPLSAPGVVAGTLFTFIPATGDYVNAAFLGGTDNQMIGNVIQSLYLKQSDYPAAAALSFVLMAIILVIVLIYIRFAGSEALMGEEAAAAMSATHGGGAWSWLREHARQHRRASSSILYLLVPIAVIFVFSFNDPAGRYNFTWVGFTLEHWKNVFGIPELNEALWTSIKLAVAGDR